MNAALNMLSMLAAFGVPALIGLAMPKRWRVGTLVLWILAPLVLLLALAGVEAARNPTGADLGNLLYGLALIGSIAALPWLLACLLGFGIGLALRRMLGTRQASTTAAPSQITSAQPAPKASAGAAPRTPAAPPITPALQPPSGWRAVHVGFDHDDLVIDGLAVWSLPWRTEAGPPVRLEHPAHPGQLHDFTVHSVDDGRSATRFAAAELSNGVWGFYRWIVPADASEGCSADGTLRYTHGHGELIGGSYDAVAPTATLSDARTGALVFDGKDWFSSRVVPQADGGLILDLEQNQRQTLFHIDPPRAVFLDLARSDPERPLGELAGAAAAAHRESLDKANAYMGRRVAPDGSMIVELAAVEWFNTHWVHSPRVTEVATGRIVLDLAGSDWDAFASFPRERAVRLALRSYRTGASLAVTIDLDAGRYAIEGREASGAVADLPTMLAREARAAAARPHAPPAAIRPRVTLRSWGVAFLILVGALVAIAAATLVTLRLQPEASQRLDRVPAMPRLPAGAVAPLSQLSARVSTWLPAGRPK
ncbi:hypothetical protein [Bosea sp. 117]|uniref:hypothetical protein n=1 Tax=Bosea sp. 117 TaxID=1125973 RepID=UPI0012DC267F|nr:hypothetical protein [Bosea sp. 117]